MIMIMIANVYYTIMIMIMIYNNDIHNNDNNDNTNNDNIKSVYCIIM